MTTRWFLFLLITLNFAPVQLYAWRTRTLAHVQDAEATARYEAETLEGSADFVVSDEYASGGKAIRLTPGTGTLVVPVEWPEGVFAVWVYGRVPNSTVDGPWPPCVIDLHVAGPLIKQVALSHQRIGYQPVYQVVTRMYHIAESKGKYQVSLRVHTDSATPLLVDFVEVRDALSGCVRKPLKKRRELVSDDGLARIRAVAEKPKKPLTYMLPEAATVEQMSEFARNIAASLPPLNSLFGGALWPTKELSEHGAKLSKGKFKLNPWYEPWALVDENGNRYDANSYCRNDPFAAGLPDTGGGQNAIVQVPVNIANVQGLAAASLTVTFDGSVLSAQGEQV